MKRYLFILALVLVSCSEEDEPEVQTFSYEEPELFLKSTEAELTASLGEPSIKNSYEYTVTYTYFSDTPEITSIDYVFRLDKVDEVKVSLKTGEQNLTAIKEHLKSTYGTPKDLIEQGGIKGLRYPVEYPLTDLNFTDNGSVIYIEYKDLYNN